MKQKNNYLIIKLIMLLASASAFSADNEIYVDQSGATANIDIEQLGISNLIGGLSSSAGSLNPLDLDGTSLTLDINMIGNTNKFLGDICQLIYRRLQFYWFYKHLYYSSRPLKYLRCK